jgi:hypothetical protein
MSKMTGIPSNNSVCLGISVCLSFLRHFGPMPRVTLSAALIRLPHTSQKREYAIFF